MILKIKSLYFSLVLFSLCLNFIWIKKCKYVEYNIIASNCIKTIEQMWKTACLLNLLLRTATPFFCDNSKTVIDWFFHCDQSWTVEYIQKVFQNSRKQSKHQNSFAANSRFSYFLWLHNFEIKSFWRFDFWRLFSTVFDRSNYHKKRCCCPQ